MRFTCTVAALQQQPALRLLGVAEGKFRSPVDLAPLRIGQANAFIQRRTRFLKKRLVLAQQTMINFKRGKGLLRERIEIADVAQARCPARLDLVCLADARECLTEIGMTNRHIDANNTHPIADRAYRAAFAILTILAVLFVCLYHNITHYLDLSAAENTHPGDRGVRQPYWRAWGGG